MEWFYEGSQQWWQSDTQTSGGLEDVHTCGIRKLELLKICVNIYGMSHQNVEELKEIYSTSLRKEWQGYKSNQMSPGKGCSYQLGLLLSTL